MKTFEELALQIQEHSIILEGVLKANRDIRDKQIAKKKNRFKRKASKAGKIASFETNGMNVKFKGMKKKDPTKSRKIKLGLKQNKNKQKTRMAKQTRTLTKQWRAGVNS